MGSVAAPFPISGSAFAPFVARGPAVQDITALKAVPVGEREDKQLRFVEDQTNDYHFDQQSAAAESLPDIVVPDAGSGRWLRVTPSGGVPAAHAASHAENASDEIFVENLGAISVVTTDALMPDGTGGLVFGSPVPAAHALGGAQHTADTLANLNSKVSDATLIDTGDSRLSDARTPTLHALGGAEHSASTLAALNALVSDATLVDSGAVVLRSGTQTLSGDWDTGAFDILTDAIRARSGASLLLKDASDASVITIADAGNMTFAPTGDIILNPTGNNILPTTTNDLNLGSPTLAYASVVTRIIRTDTGSLIIQDSGGATVASVSQSSLWTWINNVTVSWGGGREYQFRYDTAQMNDGMLIGTPDEKGNYILFTHSEHIGTDFNIGAQSVPTWIYHDGSFTLTNRTNVSQSGANFTITNSATAGVIRFQIAGASILRIGNANAQIGQIAGSDPINNTTGLDSRKLGFEARLWDGAAAQTRTGFIRFEDVSGEDDQGRFTFSSNDNGGSEADMLEIRLDTDVFIRPSTGSLILESADGTDRIEVNDTGVGFYAVSPVARASAPTAVDAAAIDSTYDSTEEGVLNNVRTRLNEVVTAIQNIGIMN